MENIVRLMGIAFAVYAAIVILVYFGQRSLLYFPPGPNSSPPAGLVEVAIHTGDGLVLNHWYRAPAPGAPVVVMFHGNASIISQSAPGALALLPERQGVFLAEYRGYGGNPGSPTEKGLAEDARGVLRWLAAQGIEPHRIILYGRSLGSGVAVQLAAESQPAALVLVSPYSSIADVAAAHYWYLPVNWLIKDRWDSHSKIGQVRTPLLMVHGEEDATIPIRFARKLFAAAHEPKRFIAVPEAGHNDILSHHAAFAEIRTFLAGVSGTE